MCNPVAIAGIALAAGGSYMKSRADAAAADSAQSAADRVLRRDQVNQQQLEDQRRVELAKAMKGQSRPELEGEARAIEARTNQQYEKAVENDYGGDREATAGTDQSSGQQVVNDEYKKRLGEALSFYRQQSQAKAKLGAPTEANQRLAIANQGNAQRIAINNSQARADSALAQDQAQRVYGKKMRKVGKFGIGDALQIAGSLASMGSGSIIAGLGTAAATAAPTVINGFGATPSAPVGAKFAPTGTSAPGLY